MPDICLGFEAHQPFRINKDFTEGEGEDKNIEELYDIYFDNELNKKILERVAEKCYLPANETILENIEKYEEKDKKFKVAYSISGVLIKQLKKWCPKVLESFKKLAKKENVEMLNQTYYHSLASIYSAERKEFKEQVRKHQKLMHDLFGHKPKIFENTEFIYNNSIAKTLEKMGYEATFTEGVDRILGWRSPNYIYKAKNNKIKTFLRNYRLSDDIAFRFSERRWTEWPLTADKYAEWLSATEGQTVNIFIDYETIGEHQWPETGIFEFLSYLPEEILKHENLRFVKPSELLKYDPVGEIDVGDFETISWADIARNTNAWLGNTMQKSCYGKLKELGPRVKDTGDEDLLEIWRLLQTSDHIYYMYTEPGAPEEVHRYFSQQSPVSVYHAFTNILSDFEEKVKEY